MENTKNVVTTNHIYFTLVIMTEDRIWVLCDESLNDERTIVSLKRKKSVKKCNEFSKKRKLDLVFSVSYGHPKLPPISGGPHYPQ